MQGGGAPEAQGRGQHLGVARCLEDGAAGFELAPQLGVVVDFAVEGDEDAAVARQQRLDRVLAVDDPQAPCAHRRAGQGTDQGVGDIAAMEQAVDEAANGRRRVFPADGDR